MIERKETKESELLRIDIIDEATTADINQIKPVIKNHIAQHKNARLMLVFTGLDEWSEIVQLWMNLEMTSDQVNKCARIALVGNAEWKGWLTKAVERMVDTELKFFGDDEMTHAQKWIQP